MELFEYTKKITLYENVLFPQSIFFLCYVYIVQLRIFERKKYYASFWEWKKDGAKIARRYKPRKVREKN